MPKISDERRAARRRQILKAAYVCFARKGFDGTRIQEICRESGLSPGALYLYFDGKDAIVRALAEDALAASEAAWTKIVEGGDGTGLDRIEKLFDLACSEGDPTAVRLSVQFWAQAFDNTFLSDAMQADHEESVERIARLLGSGSDIAPTDARALAEMTIATLRGFGLQRAIVPTIDLAPAARAFLRALRGELARAAAAAGTSKTSPSKNGASAKRPPRRKKKRGGNHG